MGTISMAGIDRLDYTETTKALEAAFAEADADGADLDLSKVASIEGDTAEKAKVMRALDERAKDLSRCHPFPPGGPSERDRISGRDSRPRRSRVWRPGHWGDTFIPEMSAGLITSGTITVPNLTGGIVPIEDRPLTMLQLIPTENLEGTDQFAYLREETREHKAATVEKGAEKLTSEYKVKKYEDTAKTIAHITEPVARQDIEDTAFLAQYVDGALRRGVQLALESQILSGKGEEAELTGISETEGILTQAFSENALNSCRKAITKLEEESEIDTGAFVMSPGHWEEIELKQEADGAYLHRGEGVPVDRLRRRLWGRPVTTTTTTTTTTTLLEAKLGYLVDFAGSTKLWERTGVRVDWSEAPEGSVENEAAFKSNELIFRGEARAGFAVTRPAGICQVSLEV